MVALTARWPYHRSDRKVMFDCTKMSGYYIELFSTETPAVLLVNNISKTPIRPLCPHPCPTHVIPPLHNFIVTESYAVYKIPSYLAINKPLDFK